MKEVTNIKQLEELRGDLEKMVELSHTDSEKAHVVATNLLLDYIGDPEVTDTFKSMERG